MTIDTKTSKDCFVSWTKSYKALKLILTVPWSIVVLLVTFMYPKHDLGPILTCCTRKSTTQKPQPRTTYFFDGRNLQPQLCYIEVPII
jgi:hypothetical protein